MRKFSRWIPALVALLLAATPAAAEITMPRSVLGNGAVLTSGDNNHALGTLGQAVVGIVTGSGHIGEIGFWYDYNQIVTGVAEPDLPLAFSLKQNFPNPFNPLTVIGFDLPDPARVHLRVYDLTGRLQCTIIAGVRMEPGRCEVTWNGRNDAGAKLSSGIYFYRIDAGSFSRTRRMVLLK
ncbi:MAG: hypothetical protein GY835_25345 [bacterium]|nr:hypothetical protein [bacterium]